MKTTDPPVIVERRFDAPIEKVWQAITDSAQMRNWFFGNIPDFRPEIGFVTRFDVNSGERIFPHLWQVTEVVPRQQLSLNWKYDGFAGDSHVHFELFEKNGRTTLRVTTEVVEDFDDAIPEFRRENCVGGWEYFIQNRLAEYLAKLWN